MTTPIIKELRVIPVAGRDGMLLNLSGAHAPYFTRNIALVRLSAAISSSSRCARSLWRKTRFSQPE